MDADEFDFIDVDDLEDVEDDLMMMDDDMTDLEGGF